MTPDEIVAATSKVELPDGWGFLLTDSDSPALIITLLVPSGTQRVWMAANLADGGLVQAALDVYVGDTEDVVLERARRVAVRMALVVRGESSKWN
jgi:hypothetical protein